MESDRELIEKELAEVLVEDFIYGLEDHVKKKGKIKLDSYQGMEDYVLRIYTTVIKKVYEIEEFNPALFREALRKRKSEIAKYVEFSG